MSPQLEKGDPSTPWGALIEYIKNSGLVDHGNSAVEMRSVESLADLLLVVGAVGASASADHHGDRNTLLLVLVSGSWCAPCRNFSPVLASCCESQGWSGGKVKVIFCSADYDTSAFTSYFAKMPSSFSALPFDEDEEDARDDLMERLGAKSLPVLLVFDPVKGVLLETNAVHAVQAVGPEGCEDLLEKWEKKASEGTGVTIGSGSATDNENAAAEASHKEEEDDTKELHFQIPAPCSLICQYFKERLLSPDLPEALSAVILKRETVDDDDTSAQSMAEDLMEGGASPERWLFRTTAPALPMGSYGNALLPSINSANAIECWEIERNDNGDICKAVVNIENETSLTRMLCVVRERIVMENKADDDGKMTVRKTLNLDGAPTMLQGYLRRRWKNESNLIFHALLGTCDRKKGASSKYL